MLIYLHATNTQVVGVRPSGDYILELNIIGKAKEPRNKGNVVKHN